jgi:hypothetical protein
MVSVDGWDGDECDVLCDITTNCTLECPFNCTVDCPCPECPIIPVPDCSPHNCSGNGFCITTNCTLECPFNCTVDCPTNCTAECPCPECPIIPVPDCSPHNCSGNGFCYYNHITDTSECDCDDGWDEDVCDTPCSIIEPCIEPICKQLVTWSCYNISKDDPSVCNGNGFCASNDDCKCFNGIYGDECDSYLSGTGICPSGASCRTVFRLNTSSEIFYVPYGGYCNKSGVGPRDPGKCVCDEFFQDLPPSSRRAEETLFLPYNISEYYNELLDSTEHFFGLYCKEWRCGEFHNENPEACSGHGSCEITFIVEEEIYYPASRCYCQENYDQDTECSLWNCSIILNTNPSVCNSHGECINHDMCKCDCGWSGPNCEDECENLDNDCCICPEELTWSCDGIDKDDPSVCSRKGICAAEDDCKCFNGVTVYNCSEEIYGGGSCWNIEPLFPSGNDLFCVSYTLANISGQIIQLPFGGVCPIITSTDPSDFYCICDDPSRSFPYINRIKNITEYAFGEFCGEWKCGDFHNEHPKACTGHGECELVPNPDYDPFQIIPIPAFYSECTCQDRYEGPECSLWTCNNISNTDPDVCSQHGECIDFDVCQCDCGWEGEWCNNETEIVIPPLNCTDLCPCEEYCTCDVCPLLCFGIIYNSSIVCSGHGICIAADTCICEDGYWGLDCSEFDCNITTPISNLNEFRWIAGNKIINQVGIYGIKGSYDTNNVIGIRSEHTSILYEDTMIIFGGDGFDNSSLFFVCLNDVWQFSISLSQFRWIGGNKIGNQVGIYGTKGTYNQNNVPGSRIGTTSILYGDTMIIFGGFGYDNSSQGYLNDVWQFDFISYHFRWTAGSNIRNQFGVYGTKETYNSINIPGGRDAHTSILYGNSMIIFGGFGKDIDDEGYLNDVWEFNFTHFRWIAGDNIRNQVGIYGTKGNYDPNNVPGGRRQHTSILYGNTMIIFGGIGSGNYTFGNLNDVWEFDFTSKQFRWIGGNKIANKVGVYGTKGTYNSTNVPGGRGQHTSILYGNTIIIFAGRGFDIDDEGFLNDVWQFDISLGQFRWIAGSNIRDQFGVYGTKEIYDTNNVPGGRYEHTSILYENTMIIFGGLGYDNSSSIFPGKLNDVWQLRLNPNCFGYNNEDNCVCSGNGICIAEDTCCCEDGYFGLECDQVNRTWCPPADIPTNCTTDCSINCTDECPCPECPPITELNCTLNCGMNGECVFNETFHEKCRCRDGWDGEFCDTPCTIPNVTEVCVVFWDEIEQLSPIPSARDSHQMVIDYNNIIYMFGGFDGSSELNDFWKYDIELNKWTQITPNVPPSRRFHQMVIDKTTNIIYIFGGFDGSSLLNDFWTHYTLGNAWAQITVTGPSPRAAHRMVIDESNGCIYVFGGNNGTLTQDLWKFDITLNTWTQIIPVSSSPSARINHQMVITNNIIYIFGGNDGSLTQDLWKYDITLNTWTQFIPLSSSPSARQSHQMVITNNIIYMFGGNDGSNKQDLWKYDIILNTWEELIPLSSCIPSARYYHQMVINDIKGDIYMFGGNDGSLKNDLWNLTDLCISCLDCGDIPTNCTTDCPLPICDLPCPFGCKCAFDSDFNEFCDCPINCTTDCPTNCTGGYICIEDPTWSCYGIDKDNTSVCFGNGYCASEDDCKCFDGTTFEFRRFGFDEECEFKIDGGGVCDTRSTHCSFIVKANPINAPENQTILTVGGQCFFTGVCQCGDISRREIKSLKEFEEYEEIEEIEKIEKIEFPFLIGKYFFGEYCSHWSCGNIHHNNPMVCSGHGECVLNFANYTVDPEPEGILTSLCDCQDGYNGTVDCSEWLCDPQCSSHGECIDINLCECECGWTGPTCDDPYGPAEECPTILNCSSILNPTTLFSRRSIEDYVFDEECLIAIIEYLGICDSIRELKENLTECYNYTKTLEEMLIQAKNAATGWLIAFIVTVSILGILLCVGFIWLLWFLFRRTRRYLPLEEETPPTSFELKEFKKKNEFKKLGPEVFF